MKTLYKILALLLLCIEVPIAITISFCTMILGTVIVLFEKLFRATSALERTKDRITIVVSMCLLAIAGTIIAIID